jgi:thiol-disulfide isomerase/thioredoxin
MHLRPAKHWLLTAIVTVALLAGGYLYTDYRHARAPDITFSIIDGRHIRLEALRGRPVLVRFWATSCPTCRKEMPLLAALYHDLHGQGLELIAVAMPYDPPNRVLEMSQEKQFPYPVALDVMGKTMTAFGDISLTPTTLLIAPDGRIVRKQIGEMDFDKLRRQIKELLPKQSQNGSYKS